ncbi:MAG: FAD-binding oxidoreductase [Anaerolineae bacterium]|nr:MAG: FAD-binding oxidoreductase [Anaerolineae bacterium]
MRRWNGWGETHITYPLPESARRYLSALVGEGEPIPDAGLQDVLTTVPASRLPNHPAITHDPYERLTHARGQSLPDWIALRYGRIASFPDGVACPASEEEVRALIAFAEETGAHLIPYGGGTSVVGHINPFPGDAPILTIDLSRLNLLLHLDEKSRLATFGAGVSGPRLEAQLRSHGYTLGHYPQSFEYSTLGGWVATRSSGQQSRFYGRIEDLFAGGRLETPTGTLELPPHPASAAGPDLRQCVLGSEGRLGILTRVVVRVRPAPRHESFRAYFFHDWEAGVEAVRAIAQAGLRLSMVRLSDPLETETTLALAGKERLIAWADRGLKLLGYGARRCLLLLGFTIEDGQERIARQERRVAEHIVGTWGGLSVGTLIGEQWRRSRFRTPYLRNTLWKHGYALDTLETAVPWEKVQETAADILSALRSGLEEEGERVLAFAHISHVYNTGASIYVTYLYRRTADPDETLARWERLKRAASRAILTHGGTISHQHGVGLDHAPYLAEEKGRAGLSLLQALCRTLDPRGMMNPGKLLPP